MKYKWYQTLTPYPTKAAQVHFLVHSGSRDPRENRAGHSAGKTEEIKCKTGDLGIEGHLCLFQNLLERLNCAVTI